MKKFIGILVGLILSANLQIFASNIEVLPTMYSRTNAQDRIWVATFQLVWNDFMDKVVFNPVRFREGTPTSVNELNKKSFKADDISEKNYYKYVGKVRKNTTRQISKALRKKFKESSDLLDKLDLTPRSDMYLVYAMLKKDFEFVREFDKLGRSIFGEEDIVDFFGIDSNSEKILRQGVEILFYNGNNDYAVKLITNDVDEVILYKNSSNKPFNFIYLDLLKKQNAYKGKKNLSNVDELKIPNIKLNEEKVFEELTNKRIMGTNIVINQAMESIKFDMNNKGVKIKSEGALVAEVTSLLPPEEIRPRLFYFDDTFVLFIKEKNKKQPYFALRVNDIKKFQPQK